MVTQNQSIGFLVGSVGLNLGVGAALGAVAVPAIKNWYRKLRKPSWTPPDAVFGPVWSTLYTAMGVASWLVFKQGGFGPQRKPLGLYAAQLALNFAWQPLFFKAKRLDLALLDITGTLVMTAATAQAFHKVNPKAGYLMLPSVAWVAYAAALNASLHKKNPGAHKFVDTSKKSFAAAVTGEKDAEKEEKMDRSEGAFSEWMEKNNKSYSSDEERARRYKIWLDNLEYIEAYNAKGGSSHLNLGPHSDLTEEEFKCAALGLNAGAANA